MLNDGGRDGPLASGRFAELLTIPGRIYHDAHFGPFLQMQGFVKEVAFDLLRRNQHRLPVMVNRLHVRVSRNVR